MTSHNYIWQGKITKEQKIMKGKKSEKAQRETRRRYWLQEIECTSISINHKQPMWQKKYKNNKF